MKIYVLFAHPNKDSFCGAIYHTVLETLTLNKHEIISHNLYEERFDPLLTTIEIPKEAVLPLNIRRHCEEVSSSDGFVVIHPNWWGQPPAILKGWIDRVLRQGVAYEFKEDGSVNGFLKGKTAVVITTSNTPRAIELSHYGDPLENLWGNCIFKFCGVSNFFRKNFESVILSTEKGRKAWLTETSKIISKYFPSI